MRTRYCDFRMKEVVNVCDGCRLGYVTDLELELPEGRICAIILPGPCRWLGLFGHDGEFIIPWQCIKHSGRDRPRALPRPATQGAVRSDVCIVGADILRTAGRIRPRYDSALRAVCRPLRKHEETKEKEI